MKPRAPYGSRCSGRLRGPGCLSLRVPGSLGDESQLLAFRVGDPHSHPFSLPVPPPAETSSIPALESRMRMWSLLVAEMWPLTWIDAALRKVGPDKST